MHWRPQPPSLNSHHTSPSTLISLPSSKFQVPIFIQLRRRSPSLPVYRNRRRIRVASPGRKTSNGRKEVTVAD
ncbi:hypothetical protein Ahy_A02g006604 isoform C [Arachis hypogaea]|uniref:Uncharacterized protein n=1 Tax=Arachis hypogaea TaxID=3818 RepID=A0A445EAN7_ARAHY|nr:hypothetical protein Ahy_A02g006604 isoform C [Arachis hypogaea]